MYERFTDRVRTVMQLANREAQRWNHEAIGTEHLLLALVVEGSGVAASILKNMGVNLETLGRKASQIVEHVPRTGPAVFIGRLSHTTGAKKVVEYAIEEARSLSHKYIGTEHILLGLLREEAESEEQILTELGLELDAVRREVADTSPRIGHR